MRDRRSDGEDRGVRQAVIREAQIKPRYRTAPGLAEPLASHYRQFALLRPASARHATNYVTPQCEFEGALVEDLEEYEIFEIFLQANRNVALDVVEIQHRHLEQAWPDSAKRRRPLPNPSVGNDRRCLFASRASRRKTSRRSRQCSRSRGAR